MELLAASLLNAFLWILLGGGVLATLVGLWLLIAPVGFASFSGMINRWVSTRQAAHWLEAPRPIERFFYRRHKVFGVLLIMGAAFALYYLGFHYDAARMLAVFALPWTGPGVEAVTSALTGFLLFGNGMVLLIGVIVLLRPSLLKGVETASNRWVSTREAFDSLDSRSDFPDEVIAHRPRLAGAVLLVAGLCTALQLGLFLV